MIDLMNVEQIKWSTHDMRRDSLFLKDCVNETISFENTSISLVKRFERLKASMDAIALQWGDDWETERQDLFPTLLTNIMFFVDGKLTSYKEIPMTNLMRSKFEALSVDD